MEAQNIFLAFCSLFAAGVFIGEQIQMVHLAQFSLDILVYEVNVLEASDLAIYQKHCR